jgi:tetratricopeptide (TPR) repeat protein
MVTVALLVVAALLAGIGWTYMRRGRRSEVPPAERHYRAGFELARAGETRRAVSEWNMAIAMNPSDPRPYGALDDYWEAAGRPDVAAETMERLSRANPAAAHRDCRFARAAFAAGWTSRATEAADRAAREEPACPLAHTMRGIVLDDAGEASEALAELMRAHQLSPDDARIALTLAQLEGRSGLRASAQQHVAEVLKREPDSPQAHYLSGWLAARAVPPTAAADAAAERQFRAVLAQELEHAGARADLGALYVRQGRFAQARPLLEAAGKQRPDDPPLARNLALTYAHLGDPRAAPLAAAARRLEERQQRRLALRRRHRREPANATVTLQLARLELAAGQTREANDLTRQILAADPTNRPALELLHQTLGAP